MEYVQPPKKSKDHFSLSGGRYNSRVENHDVAGSKANASIPKVHSSLNLYSAAGTSQSATLDNLQLPPFTLTQPTHLPPRDSQGKV